MKNINKIFSKKYLLSVLSFLSIFLIVLLINSQTQTINNLLHSSSDPHIAGTFFLLSVIFVLSFAVFYGARIVSIPSFVIAIVFGMAARKLLLPVTSEVVLMGELVGLGATLILFAGGLETPWENFKKLSAKILSLSFIGLLLTAFLFSLTVLGLSRLFNLDIPIYVAVLLGAVLASTDPAAIIPVLKTLRFKNRDTKDIAISESAVTDVTGTLLTVVFLGLIVTGVNFTGVLDGYNHLFSLQTGAILAKQILFGVFFGVLGFGFLEVLSNFKKRHDEEYEADAAYFIAVPILIFTASIMFGGSGYLAAFIAGLMFAMTEQLHGTERFFNQTIEGFLKPMIFIILGALVDLGSLIETAPIGILAALIFMFIIRPLAVLVSLAPFKLFSKNGMSWREMLFISFVRETGAIPAVLLVTIVGFGLPGMDGLVPLGMWVILATLIIQPPLTPLVARLLDVAEPMSDKHPISIDEAHRPYVVLGSRGQSFVPRLQEVVKWADEHSISRVVLLHCLEDKFNPALIQQISMLAGGEFAKINDERVKDGKELIVFSHLNREGLLQQNIDELANSSIKPTAIFVGKKILDYRLEQIKKLQTPLYFLD